MLGNIASQLGEKRLQEISSRVNEFKSAFDTLDLPHKKIDAINAVSSLYISAIPAQCYWAAFLSTTSRLPKNRV
jgi:hypothetical protein